MGIEYSEHFENFGDLVELDPLTPLLIACFGKKGSGKSTWSRSLYQNWPLDKLAIDVNGDFGPGDDAQEIFDPLPSMFPEDPEGNPRNLHYRADPGSPNYRENLDRAIGLGLFPKENPTLLALDEIGEFTSGSSTSPRLRRLLMQSRHYRLTAVMAGPRPMDIDPLVIAQSDLIVIYDLPNPADQKRVADIIGFPLSRFSEAVDQMREEGPHHHLVFAAGKVSKNGKPTLALCDPIDLD